MTMTAMVSATSDTSLIPDADEERPHTPLRRGHLLAAFNVARRRWFPNNKRLGCATPERRNQPVASAVDWVIATLTLTPQSGDFFLANFPALCSYYVHDRRRPAPHPNHNPLRPGPPRPSPPPSTASSTSSAN